MLCAVESVHCSPGVNNWAFKRCKPFNNTIIDLAATWQWADWIPDGQKCFLWNIMVSCIQPHALVIFLNCDGVLNRLNWTAVCLIVEPHIRTVNSTNFSIANISHKNYQLISIASKRICYPSSSQMLSPHIFSKTSLSKQSLIVCY